MSQVFERLRIFTPLGIRFLDAAADQPVAEGLDVRAALLNGGPRWHRATRTISGIYAFHGLPRLRETEYPEEEEATTSPPDSREFVIEVRDHQRRFVPVMFTEELPLTERGIYTGPLAVGSPPADVSPGFYLFSAPTRPARPGLAQVRAQLVEYDPELGEGNYDRPAAFALVEVSHGGTTWYGLSAENGGLAVLLPYPPLTTTLTGSPPAGKTPLHEQEWSLSIRIRYAPHQLEYVDESNLPELRSVVGQMPALIYSTLATSPVLDVPAFEATSTLRYGEVCVLRTGDRPVLWVEGQPSSP